MRAVGVVDWIVLIINSFMSAFACDRSEQGSRRSAVEGQKTSREENEVRCGGVGSARELEVPRVCWRRMQEVICPWSCDLLSIDT